MRAWPLAVGVCVIAACGGGQPRGEGLVYNYATTPYEGYEYAIRQAGLEQTALGYEWIMAGRFALTRALSVDSPYEEVGYLEPLEAGAMGFRVSAERGQLLRIEVEMESDDPSRVFLDLFRIMDDTLRPYRHEAYADSIEHSLEFLVRRTGDYVMRVQPELLRGGRYRIRIINAASLGFPVDGRGVTAIRSVFGDLRDGGRREHQGVDIFAPRGTPVIAASDGRIRSVRTGGLGGKTVWLRDRFGQSQYYAHLDSQAVRRGDSVKLGDTLGFVGNTGNARTTPPHLHFGVYSRGAYDPFPSLNPLPTDPPHLSADTANVGGWARNTIDGLRLRESPRRTGSVLGELARSTPMLVVGGAGSWYRVLLPDGAMGFVTAASLEPASQALRNTSLSDGGLLLESPLATSAVRDSVGPGSQVEVLGEFGEFLFVRASKGLAGWLSFN
jgi:murein DD-endopeptidase MepM/ murein hydrolase activator NlpD